jgi:hypothetical protein
MHRYAELARFFLLVVCLVPFTSTRQAAACCAPAFPVAPALPAEAPAPLSEEEDERESEADGKERLADPARHRVAPRESAARLPIVHAGHASSLVLCSRAPVPANPLRNGLGTHYRC